MHVLDINRTNVHYHYYQIRSFNTLQPPLIPFTVSSILEDDTSIP